MVRDYVVKWLLGLHPRVECQADLGRINDQLLILYLVPVIDRRYLFGADVIGLQDSAVLSRRLILPFYFFLTKSKLILIVSYDLAF